MYSCRKNVYKFVYVTYCAAWLCNVYYTAAITCIIIYRFICRARLIPFIHPLQYNLQSTTSINEAYEVAPAAGPSLIRIGHYLANMEPKALEKVQAHVQTLVPLLDSRGVIEYTILVASALLVINL